MYYNSGMERTTKTTKLPLSNLEVVYYSYITAGEKQQITEIMTSGMSADITGSVKGEIPLSLVYKSNDKALELLVKSLNGSTENVLSQIKDLPSSDYDLLLTEINDVTNNTDYNQKKTT